MRFHLHCILLCVAEARAALPLRLTNDWTMADRKLKYSTQAETNHARTQSWNLKGFSRAQGIAPSHNGEQANTQVSTLRREPRQATRLVEGILNMCAVLSARRGSVSRQCAYLTADVARFSDENTELHSRYPKSRAEGQASKQFILHSQCVQRL
jgi:hypothetical protein